jgi:hypothetical protein
MTRSLSRRRPADATDINAELSRIAAMNIEELREMWREERKTEPLAALTKDLMARAVAHWLQEERLGGLEPLCPDFLPLSRRRAPRPRDA